MKRSIKRLTYRVRNAVRRTLRAFMKMGTSIASLVDFTPPQIITVELLKAMAESRNRREAMIRQSQMYMAEMASQTRRAEAEKKRKEEEERQELLNSVRELLALSRNGKSPMTSVPSLGISLPIIQNTDESRSPTTTTNSEILLPNTSEPPTNNSDG